MDVAHPSPIASRARCSTRRIGQAVCALARLTVPSIGRVCSCKGSAPLGVRLDHGERASRRRCVRICRIECAGRLHPRTLLGNFRVYRTAGVRRTGKVSIPSSRIVPMCEESPPGDQEWDF